MLDLLWQYVVNDSVATIRDACEKVSDDRGIRDNSLAFVQTPSLIKASEVQESGGNQNLGTRNADG